MSSGLRLPFLGLRSWMTEPGVAMLPCIEKFIAPTCRYEALALVLRFLRGSNFRYGPPSSPLSEP